MSGIMWVSIGFVLGGILIGNGVAYQVQNCIDDHKMACSVEHTWTGVKVRPYVFDSPKGED